MNCELAKKNFELKSKSHSKVKGVYVSHQMAGYKIDRLFWKSR